MIGNPERVAHTYTQGGTFTYTVTATNVLGDSTNVAFDVEVFDVLRVGEISVRFTPESQFLFSTDRTLYLEISSNRHLFTGVINLTIDYNDNSEVERSTIPALPYNTSHLYIVGGIFTLSISLFNGVGSPLQYAYNITVAEDAVQLDGIEVTNNGNVTDPPYNFIAPINLEFTALLSFASPIDILWTISDESVTGEHTSVTLGPYDGNITVERQFAQPGSQVTIYLIHSQSSSPL